MSSHVDGGRRCLVAHAPGHGQCVRCERCGQWIAPADMAGYCGPDTPKARNEMRAAEREERGKEKGK